MATNITFRKTDSALNKPSATTVKNAPLSSLEIDGNFKSIKDNLDEMIEGGVGKLVQRHDVVSLGGQTIFDLPFSYTPGMDALMVFVNGVLGVAGSRYTETSSTRITMTPALALGDKVTVMANVSPINNLPYNPVDGRKDLFVAGTHYTKNTTTSVTLSSTPAKSGTVKVFFDGIYQNKDTYYIVGNVVYFGVIGSLVVIPVDTVEVQYEIPSEFVGLSVADIAVLTAAQNAAQASANAAAASFDSFDDRYLGAKSVAPIVDNDGNTILVGAKYFNSTENKMYFRNSSNAWQLDTADSSTVNYLPAGTGAVASSATVESKLRDIMSSGPVLLRPAYLDQFVDGFFGRGMLTAETDNLVTEQFVTAPAVSGAWTISVTSATNLIAGGCVTVKHDNGRYGTYFLAGKTGNVLTIFPSLRYGVSTASKIERTWFNRAHPGKFYMRELAQRIASTTELEAAMPSGGRILFANFASSPNTVEDSLVAVSGGVVNYYDASNEGAGGITSPVRFGIGRTAYVTAGTVGSGAETRLFAVGRDTECVAKLVFAATSAASVYKIEVLDETGKAFNEVLATYNAPSGASGVVLQTRTITFNTRSSKYLKVRVTCASSPNNGFYIDQIDVFEAPATNSLIISKRGAKIVCIGDSWVAGDLASTPEREPITTQLASELPDATIINAGIGGNKIWEQVARFDTDVAVHKPDYVVVNTGTNEAYNPASGIFEPNSVDYFIAQYRIMINKIIGIGARPIIVGVPALAQSDSATSYTDWLLNNRARSYVKAFYEFQGARPLAFGARSGLESYRTDALLTSGATPSVAYMRRVDLDYSSATTITNLLNGVSGQVVTLVARNSNCTLQHGGLLLHGAVNVVLTNNSTITLMRLDTSYSEAWVEIGRSITSLSEGPLEVELTSGSTPDVSGAKYVNLNYGSPTTITNFTGGATNQEIQIRAINGNVTLTHGTFQLTGSVNVTLTSNSVITLRRANIGQSGAWYEVSRSIK